MSSGDSGASRSMFGFQGIWTPGVKLLRTLSFPAKASIVVGLLLIPVVILALAYFQSAMSQVDFALKERDGVVYVKATIKTLEAVQTLRGEVSGGNVSPAAQQQFDAAFKALGQVEQSLGKDLGTSEAFAKLGPLLSKAASEKDPEAARLVYVAFVEALDSVKEQAVLNSNLALDPDADSYNLMAAVTDHLPSATEALALMRSTGARVLTAGKFEGNQRDIFVRNVSLAEHHLDEVDKHLEEVYKVSPQLKASMRINEAVAAAHALDKFIETNILNDLKPGDGAALRTRITETITSLHAANQRALDALDGLLVQRIEGLRAKELQIAALLVVTLALALYVFVAFYRVTRGGNDEVARHLKAITDGDLTTNPRPWGRDEPAQLMLVLAAMQQSLRGIVGQVRSASDGIVSASSEIASASQDLSARTEQGAAALEESSATMEEISSTVKATADNAHTVAELATQNAKVAQKAGSEVGRVVKTMQDINQSSTKIADIIGVIDGIAFQTNILALNAAVEAARAGEQGRGFAVVASEVRALAQRSANAAKEIKALITTSVEQVGSGTAVVQSAGATIDELVSSADRMNKLLAEIANGAREQATGVDQIGTAIQELDRNTQQNAALVEETSAAAVALSDQAHGLADKVSKFVLP